MLPVSAIPMHWNVKVFYVDFKGDTRVLSPPKETDDVAVTQSLDDYIAYIRNKLDDAVSNYLIYRYAIFCDGDFLYAGESVESFIMLN